MAKENDVYYENHKYSMDLSEPFDFDELEEELENKLEEELKELEFLQREMELIGSTDNLGIVIKDVVWEQFINQIAVSAGEDFIKENNGLTLDLRNEAHIQTAENFERQNYAKHNTYVNYEERGKEYRSNFYTDPNDMPKAKQKQPQRYNEETKVWETYDNVDGEYKKTLREDYRIPYENDRKKDKKNKYGNTTINKDHQIADATIARDARAGAYMTIEEKVKMANSEYNLYDLDSAANQSKSDHDGEKWVKHTRTGRNGAGHTNGEYFGIDEEEYIKQDQKAKKKIAETLDNKEAENIALGKQSQKEEAFRIGGKVLRAVVIQLLADLVKEIIAKLVKWFKSAKKDLKSLLDKLKEAIHSFIGKMKTHLINAGTMAFNTVATAIVGPIFGMIKKVWMLLKQGWKSLRDAVNYIKSPENKGKPIGRLMFETGKIIIAGLTGAGALVLGEVIEKGLMSIPIFAVEIPLLGSLANILGIFFGAVVAGIIGAIAINLIEKRIEKSQKAENIKAQINKGNEVLNIQNRIRIVSEAKLEHDKGIVTATIRDRHQVAADMIRGAIENIMANCKEDETTVDTFDDIKSLLTELESD